MSEYLRLLGTRSVRLDKLTQRVFPVAKVSDAFSTLTGKGERPLLVILEYSHKTRENGDQTSATRTTASPARKAENIVRVGLIGAGAFATGVHLPNIARLANLFKLEAVVDSTGLKAQTVAHEFKARLASSDVREAISDSAIDLLMIATRHDSHAALVLEGLKAGKHVFVEKPLAISQVELDAIKNFYARKSPATKPLLMVGYNRRFSKYAEEIKKHVAQRINPLYILYRMNAGFIPRDHWIHESGGRLVGEACHIVDLMTFLTNAQVESISVESLRPSSDRFGASDNKSIILKYIDGSICTIEYFAIGSKEFPKEYMEVHFDGKTIVLDDFKSLRGYGVDIRRITSASSEKGHPEELLRLHRTLSGQESAWPIALWDMFQTTSVTLELASH